MSDSLVTRRDCERIPPVIRRLETLWKMMPGLRLGQLIGNVYHSTDGGGVRQYFDEDEEFIQKLEEYYTSLLREGRQVRHEQEEE